MKWIAVWIRGFPIVLPGTTEASGCFCSSEAEFAPSVGFFGILIPRPLGATACGRHTNIYTRLGADGQGRVVIASGGPPRDNDGLNYLRITSVLRWRSSGSEASTQLVKDVDSGWTISDCVESCNRDQGYLKSSSFDNEPTESQHAVRFLAVLRLRPRRWDAFGCLTHWDNRGRRGCTLRLEFLPSLGPIRIGGSVRGRRGRSPSVASRFVEAAQFA